MTLVNLVIFGLATWRVSSLFSKESGPLDVFLKIRELSGITHDVDKNVVMIPDNFFAQMISCMWCNSIYIGVFWAVTFYFFPVPSPFLALPFALSAITVFLEKVIPQ